MKKHLETFEKRVSITPDLKNVKQAVIRQYGLETNAATRMLSKKWKNYVVFLRVCRFYFHAEIYYIRSSSSLHW